VKPVVAEDGTTVTSFIISPGEAYFLNVISQQAYIKKLEEAPFWKKEEAPPP